MVDDRGDGVSPQTSGEEEAGGRYLLKESGSSLATYQRSFPEGSGKSQSRDPLFGGPRNRSDKSDPRSLDRLRKSQGVPPEEGGFRVVQDGFS